MATYCTAKFCHHPNTHNSLGHKCSKCSNYGHGPEECQIKNLTPSLIINNIPEANQCSISGCNHPTTHTNQGHQCRSCKKYGHGWKHCDIYAKCVFCNITGHITDECIYSDPSKIAGSAPGKLYVTKYEGMGCYSLHRRNHPSEPFTVFNMHSDSWGQYGFSDVPKLKIFIQGYRPLRKIDIIVD